MTTTTRNDYLPAEILKTIFNHVPDSHDSKNVKLVCKSWYFVAIYHYGDLTRACSSEHCLNDLGNDLVKYLTLGPKIKCMHIVPDNNDTSCGSSREFMRVITLCPNLMELNLEVNNAFYFLRSMNRKYVFLPQIQNLYIAGLEEASPSVKRYHIKTVLKLRLSLTHLEILDLESNQALIVDAGGLNNLVKRIPNLTTLNVGCYLDWKQPNQINFASLFDKNSPLGLETVILRGGKIQSIIYTGTVNVDLLDTTPYDSLKTLELSTAYMDIGNLQYIMTKFRKIQRLRLNVTKCVTVDYSTTSANKAEEIINQFTEFCTRRIDAVANFSCNFRRDMVHITHNRPKLA